MFTIKSKKQTLHGELWETQRDGDKWVWSYVTLPYLAHQDLGLGHKSKENLQENSDLDLKMMPFHMFRIPSVFFFPYITFIVGNWFDRTPSFVIPRMPLNRLQGRYWLDGLASTALEILNPHREDMKLAWINSEGIALNGGLQYSEVIRLASAAKNLFLDEIRYVYDETKSAFDSKRTNTPARYCFNKNVAQFGVTKEYLDWYVEKFNDFFTKLITIGKNSGPQGRNECLIAGWTISRLAVDLLSILSTDVPYVRKWQFFSFVDALASLQNELDGIGRQGDTQTAKTFLNPSFFKDSLHPLLLQIPIEPIRNSIIDHTNSIYNAINKLGVKDRTGADLLWAYRNSRHGYSINPKDRKILFLHDGKIPNDLPDLTIALWHYILLEFPFRS